MSMIENNNKWSDSATEVILFMVAHWLNNNNNDSRYHKLYIYAMNINELMNKNINFQQIIITTQIFGTQWYLYQEQK